MKTARTPEQAAIIRAQNNAHRIANEAAPKIAEALQQFQGAQIVKQDGELLAKVAKTLPDLRPYNYPATHNARAFVKVSGACLWLQVCGIDQFSQTHGEIAVYRDAAVYLGNIDGAILTKIATPEPLREDYNADEIEAARRAVEEAEEALRTARRNLAPFSL